MREKIRGEKGGGGGEEVKGRRKIEEEEEGSKSFNPKKLRGKVKQGGG